MSALSAAIYNLLSVDSVLIALLSKYKDSPAIFTIDPVPGDALLPYVISAGEVSRVPFDTKTNRGLNAIRDIRCYAAADGSSILIEQIAERVRFLVHRKPLVIAGYNWVLSDATGPIVANEADVYGRIVSLSVIAQESV